MPRTLFAGLTLLAGLTLVCAPLFVPDIDGAGVMLAGFVGGLLTILGARHV